jgi:hypothetical protein
MDTKIEHIQIAPYKEDCTITEKAITGTMDGRTFVYELTDDTFNLDWADEFIKCFQTAIALCSKQWQVEELLNTHFKTTGKFYEK